MEAPNGLSLTGLATLPDTLTAPSWVNAANAQTNSLKTTSGSYLQEADPLPLTLDTTPTASISRSAAVKPGTLESSDQSLSGQRTNQAAPNADSLNTAGVSLASNDLLLDASAPIHINFQPDSAPVPTGYIKDIGQAYSDARGYGWVTQASLSSATHTPLDLTPNTRDRNRAGIDQRLDTLIHMQFPSSVSNATAVRTPGAWEYAVPNGQYSVTVSVGDQPAYDSQNTINVEGVNAISLFKGTSGQEYKQATVVANVSDGKLTIDAIGGTNTKLNYVDIQSVTAGSDTTAPTASLTAANLTAAGGSTYDFSVTYSDNTAVNVSTLDAGDLQVTGPTGVVQPLTLVSLNDSSNGSPRTATYRITAPGGSWDAADNGTYAVALLNNQVSDTAANFAPAASLGSFNVNISTSGSGEIEVENLDGVPFSDRLAFNRIGSLTSPPSNGVHNLATLRIKNTGSGPLQLSGVSITGPWELANTTPLPSSVPAGSFLDLPVRFVATSGDLKSGTLTIQSNDSDEPSTVVQLGGFWQSVSEGGQEPSLNELKQVFGYTTQITGTGQQLNRQGLVQAVGEEELSAYWQRADASQPVTVRQLAAYHTQGNTATVNWYAKGSNTTAGIFTHAGIDGQSILPRKNGSTTAPAQGTFNPNSTFGFKIDSEWSDPNKNNQTPDKNNGSPGPSGHHVRFWPARDRQGAIIPNTWLMTMDYSGINYDYNDNVYLVSNIKPEAREALYRLDAGTASGFSYTDTHGNVWTSDAGFFGPSTAKDENGGNPPPAIANTDDDVLYQTYRGNVGSTTPRTLKYSLPISTPSTVDIRLHFAELAWTSADKRIFDVTVEGTKRMDNFDIFKESGGAKNATVVQIRGVQVNDGVLNIDFTPETDYASIAAIEVLRPLS
jgi:hypothetical protein